MSIDNRGKRILLVFDVCFPFVKGGAQRRFYEVGRRLSREGWQVDWMTFQSWPGEQKIQHEGINYCGIGMLPSLYNRAGKRSKLEPLIFFFQFLRNLHKLKNYDVVWVGQWPVLHIILATIAAKFYKIKLFVDWWEVWPKENWIKYSKSVGWAGYLFQSLILKSLSRNAVIITDCNLEATRIQNVIVRESRLHTIPNGIPVDEIGHVDLNQPAEYDVVSLGRLKNHKRVDLIIEAVWSLREHHGIVAKAAIVGDGPERAVLEKLVEKLELKDQVTFFGHIPDQAKVYEIVKKGKLCVVSTVSGGGGNLTLFEAYGCGLPVVAFKLEDGIDEALIEHEKTGLFVDNVGGEGLATALAGVLNKPDMLESMKKSALSKSKDFDWDNIYKTYEVTFNRYLTPLMSH